MWTKFISEISFHVFGLDLLKLSWPPASCSNYGQRYPPQEPQMPDDPANLWNRWAVHLLPCITMQCGILALPFHTSTPGWEQLPVALAMLIKGDHQTIRHQLHKAEEHSIAGFEFICQQCRGYRWSAEILPATDEQSILIHAYWGLGHAPCAAPSGVRIMHSLPRFVRRIQRTDTTSAGAHALGAAAACTQDL